MELAVDAETLALKISLISIRACYCADMEGPNNERWRDLCEQAAVEQDPAKMLKLLIEINDILEEKEKILKAEQMIYESKKRTDAA